MAPPTPLSVLGVVFVAWPLGVLVVVAVARGTTAAEWRGAVTPTRSRGADYPFRANSR